MLRKRLRRAVLIASIAAAGAGLVPAWLSGSAPAGGTAAAQGRSLPVFEVDGAWPTVPAEMKLGAPSSIAIDAEDNVWVLHRPLTLPPEQAAMAAPPVVVFDAAGNFIKAWGGAGTGYEWPNVNTVSTSITRASSGWAATTVRPTACPGSSRSTTTSC